MPSVRPLALVATALVTSLAVVAAPSVSPARAGLLPGAETTVYCHRSPTELTRDGATYRLRGTCGTVKVLADDTTVRMPTATRLVVRGQGNTVVSKSVGTLVVRGRDQVVRPRSARLLTIASPGSTVASPGLVETARLLGRGATVRADRLSTLTGRGDRNTVRSGPGYDVRLAGDGNDLRYRRLDALVVTGDRNAVRVRRGATTVSNDGARNRIRVAHRR